MRKHWDLPKLFLKNKALWKFKEPVSLSKSISRILYTFFLEMNSRNKNALIIYLSVLLPAHFCCLPSNNRACRPLPTDRDVGIHDIAPHRVYLVSLQHDLYILSVALFLISRPMAINHYVALRCSDFPPSICMNSDKANYLRPKLL